MATPVITATSSQTIIVNTAYRLRVSISNEPIRVLVRGKMEGFDYEFTGGVLTIEGTPTATIGGSIWRVYAIDRDDLANIVEAEIEYQVVNPAPVIATTLGRIKIGKGTDFSHTIGVTNHTGGGNMRGLLTGLKHRSTERGIETFGVVDEDRTRTQSIFTADINVENDGGEHSNTADFELVDAPSEVRSLRATSTRAGIVTLTWLAPAETGGYAISNYQWRLGEDGDWNDTNSAITSVRLSQIFEAGTYTFYVRAENSDGVIGKTASPVTHTVIRVTVPETPTVRASVVGNRVTVSWSSNGDGGSPINGWGIDFYSPDGDDIVLGASTTSRVYTVTDIGTFSVYVRARNSEGWSFYGSASYTFSGIRPTVGTVTSITQTQGTGVSIPFVITGIPTPTVFVSGLPAGTFGYTLTGILGTLSTTAIPGTYTVTVTVRNSVGSASVSFSFTVLQLAITPFWSRGSYSATLESYEILERWTLPDISTNAIRWAVTSEDSTHPLGYVLISSSNRLSIGIPRANRGGNTITATITAYSSTGHSASATFTVRWRT